MIPSARTTRSVANLDNIRSVRKRTLPSFRIVDCLGRAEYRSAVRGCQCACVPATLLSHLKAVAKRTSTSSAHQLSPQAQTIEELRARAKHCKACDLWRNATQTVFGEGAAHPKILFIGEQPGDQEDLQGRPFVGPAGKL